MVTGQPRLDVSDTEFGAHHLFVGNGLTPADRAEDTLFRRLHHDFAQLDSEHGLRPDLLVVTGDLAEWGLRSEFGQVTEFLGAAGGGGGAFVPARGKGWRGVQLAR
jgi:3',5'-cyclic AMP phosphodiesterase CpdA